MSRVDRCATALQRLCRTSDAEESTAWRQCSARSTGSRSSPAAASPSRPPSSRPWGLDGDRRWMLVDDEGETVTAREHRRMLLLHPALRADGGLDVTGPDLATAGGAARVRRADPGDRVRPRAVPRDARDGRGACLVLEGGRRTGAAGLRRRSLAPAGQSRLRRTGRRRWRSRTATRCTSPPTASLDQLNDWIAEGPRRGRGRVADDPVPSRTSWCPAISSRSRRTAGAGCASATRLPRREGVRPLRDPDHRRGHGRAVQGADVLAGAAPASFDGAVWFGMDLVPDNPGVDGVGRRRGRGAGGCRCAGRSAALSFVQQRAAGGVLPA